MSLIDAYSSDLEARDHDLLARPMPQVEQAPRFSIWGTLAAAPRGLAAGAQEALASTADVLGAFGSVASAVDARPGGMFSVPGDDAKQQMEVAAQRLREQGPDYRSGASGPLREWAQTTMPDPQTSHAAEQAVAELFRVGGKAIGAAVALGPVAGAAVAGAEEGFTASDKLAEQGVDVVTRTKVGAVTAAVQAATFALPVAGKTVGKTAALALGGGPVAFMGQQAAIRSILQSADYDQLAAQYDPFDPVGLTLSTIVPLGFGALAMRGARSKVAETPPGDKTPVAQGVESMRPSPEHVDAARVALVRETVDSWNLAKPDDVVAANAHLLAMARAADQLGTGGRVDVSDLLPPEALTQTRALDTMIERMESRRVELLAEAADRADPGAVRALRTELEQLQAQLPDVSDDAARSLAKTLQAKERISYKQALAQANKQLHDKLHDVQARITRVQDAIQRNANAQQAFDALNVLDREIEGFKGTRQQIDAPPSAPRATAQAAKAATQAEQVPRVKVPEPAAPVQAAGKVADPAEAGAKAADLASLQARADDVEMLDPELPVMLEGMDSPAPLREVMERVRAEVAQDLEDVDLLQVAAACALRN